MSHKTRVSIVGASGYVGGEALRLLLQHPLVEVAQVTSERYAGKSVTRVHPNLRGFTKLKFSSLDELQPCDVLIVSLPHMVLAEKIDSFTALAPKIIDKSADFRLRSATDYQEWYGYDHPRPDLLSEFVYGIPELNREKIAKANFVACAGCNATVTNLALYPFVREDLIDLDHIIVDVKTGSSEAGNKASSGTHHPERTHVVRTYAATSHRHQAEVEQELGLRGKHSIHFTATAIELVRGSVATCHLFLRQPMEEKSIWNVLRRAYKDESFVRIVKEKHGLYRMPEPKILAGSNFCDVGFEVDSQQNRIVVVAAIDNLVKGAAGQAVQCMNLMLGIEEKTGLSFPGLHPV